MDVNLYSAKDISLADFNDVASETNWHLKSPTTKDTLWNKRLNMITVSADDLGAGTFTGAVMTKLIPPHLLKLGQTMLIFQILFVKIRHYQQQKMYFWIQTSVEENLILSFLYDKNTTFEVDSRHLISEVS